MQFKLNQWISMLAIVGLLAGCGGDSGAGAGAAAVSDHPGANTPITSANAQVVAVETAAALNGALGRVLAAAASKPVAEKSVGNKVVNGLRSGKVTIKSGAYDVTATQQTLKVDVVFEDFSDDGQIWIGGPLNIDLQSSINVQNPTALSLSFKQKGDLAFAGKYKGKMTLDLDVSIQGGVPTVKGSVTVDGNRLSF